MHGNMNVKLEIGNFWFLPLLHSVRDITIIGCYNCRPRGAEGPKSRDYRNFLGAPSDSIKFFGQNAVSWIHVLRLENKFVIIGGNDYRVAGKEKTGVGSVSYDSVASLQLIGTK